ncbi:MULTISPECIES: hypothetical protein [Dickeya]|uniref:hypothetical protein n=1 Tax=Dickeya TaxID=204037 RepID=UPI00082FB9E2|nr:MULTISPECIES: hypothetical protein [Dickeya]
MEIDIGNFTPVDGVNDKAVYAEATIYTDPAQGGENVSLYLRLPYDPNLTIGDLQRLTKLEAIKKMRAAADWLSETE